MEKPRLKLIGEDGNAFNLLAIARRVAESHNMDWETIYKEATSGDYSKLLQTLDEYFEVV